MKRILFGLLPLALFGCETTQVFTVTDMVQAIGVGLDLAAKYGWLTLPGVTA